MKVFSQRQIKELENYTIENEPIASIDLMERAAKKVAATIIKHYDNSRGLLFSQGRATMVEMHWLRHVF